MVFFEGTISLFVVVDVWGDCDGGSCFSFVNYHFPHLYWFFPRFFLTQGCHFLLIPKTTAASRLFCFFPMMHVSLWFNFCLVPLYHNLCNIYRVSTGYDRLNMLDIPINHQKRGLWKVRRERDLQYWFFFMKNQLGRESLWFGRYTSSLSSPFFIFVLILDEALVLVGLTLPLFLLLFFSFSLTSGLRPRGVNSGEAQKEVGR